MHKHTHTHTYGYTKQFAIEINSSFDIFKASIKSIGPEVKEQVKRDTFDLTQTQLNQHYQSIQKMIESKVDKVSCVYMQATCIHASCVYVCVCVCNVCMHSSESALSMGSGNDWEQSSQGKLCVCICLCIFVCMYVCMYVMDPTLFQYSERVYMHLSIQNMCICI
jgi:hypothetical protein